MTTTRRGGSGARHSDPSRILGRHPVLGAELLVHDGRSSCSQRSRARTRRVVREASRSSSRTTHRTVSSRGAMAPSRPATSPASTGHCSSTTTCTLARLQPRAAGTRAVRPDSRTASVRTTALPRPGAAEVTGAAVHGVRRIVEQAAVVPRRRRTTRAAQPCERPAVHRWPVPGPLGGRFTADARVGLGLERFPTPCGPAWGHGGNFPGYVTYVYSSPSGSRQTVLLLNEDPETLAPKVGRGFMHLLNAAHCGADEARGRG